MRRLGTMTLLGAVAATSGTASSALIVTEYDGPNGGVWTQSLNWSAGTIPNNGGGDTFDVSVNNDASAVEVLLDTLATIDTLTIDAGDAVRIDNGRELRINGASGGDVFNSGTIYIDSSASNTYFRPISGAYHLMGGGVIEMSESSANWMYALSAGSIDNVDNIIRGAGNIGFNQSAVDNGGTIEAIYASTQLLIDPGTAGGMTNTGTLRARDGAQLTLAAASYTNTGGLVEALDGSLVQMGSGAVITGGTLDTAGTGAIQAGSSGAAVLVDVTNNGLVSSPNGTRMHMIGTITNNDTMTLDSTGGNTYLQFVTGPVFLEGGGTVTASDSTTNWMYGQSGGSLVNVDNTIQGGLNLGFNQSALENQSLILANALTAPMTVDPGSAGMINSGTMRADGGTLQLLAGNYDNTGGLIEALDGSVVELTSGTSITGGNLDTAGSGVIQSNSSGASVITDVTNDGLISVPDGTRVHMAGTITNNDMMTIDSIGGASYLQLVTGPVFLQGGGTITASDSTNNWMYGQSGGSLVNVDNTIEGGLNLGFNQSALENQWLILANAPTAPMKVDPGTTGGMINSGTMRADGGTLRLEAGNYDNTGGLIEALDGSVVELASSTSITGGTLDTTGSGVLRSTSSGASSIADLTNDGLISVPNGTRMHMFGTITNNDTITIDSTGGATYLQSVTGPVMLEGGGTVTASDASNNYMYAESGGSVNNVDNTIEGAMRLGFNQSGVTNGGTFHANAATNAFIIDASTAGFLNTGTLRASGAAGMQILTGPMDTSGQVIVEAGSSLARTGDFTQTGGSTMVEGALSATGTVDLQGGTLSGNGMVIGDVSNVGGVVGPGASAGGLSVDGTFTQEVEGTLDVEIAGLIAATEHDQLNVTGAVDAGGLLRVTLLDGYEPIVGDSFVIVTGDPVGGAFGCFDLPELQLGARFILQYNPNDITALVSNLPPNDADLNRDGTVGFADLTILLNNWGPCIKATSCCIGDISGDGIRGFTDLTIILANWGE